MARNGDPPKRHFLLQDTARSEPFTAPKRGGGGDEPPHRNRTQHGRALLRQLHELNPEIAIAGAAQREAGQDEGFGLQIEFQSFPDVELTFESLARERSGIELRNVRHVGDRTFATVFVPEGKLEIFERLITNYLDKDRDTKSGPKYRNLLDTIASIRAATLEALWTDDREALPTDENEVLWWEVWLSVGNERDTTTERFRLVAERKGFRVAPGELRFPERTVLLANGSVAQMKQSVMTLNNVAELRRAKETAEFFESMPLSEQREWLDDLLGRLRAPGPDDNVPYVCLFDTGVNHGHPLLSPVLDAGDRHTVEPAWGVDDGNGHGTCMAGLAIAGDLTKPLADNTPIEFGHRLESVKLVPHDGANGGDPLHHGYLTIQAVARPEITAPQRKRVFSMAVTARDNRDRGRPTAWSATVDGLAADTAGEAAGRRLFILSAGNIDDNNAWTDYPASNTTDSIHDPSQAWNALTIGAATHLVQITEPNTDDYHPIAPEGGLSPFSTTSQTWDAHWPLKPDVVLEGGNAATDAFGPVTMASLSLLTTNSRPANRLFTTANATSAAAAIASRLAAQIMTEYPEIWPETVRALIVHSAQWTPAMRQQFLPEKGRPTKGQLAELVRHCGYGIPDLDRALWSLENSLTMVCEGALQPFHRNPKEDPKLHEMNFHRLPWPRTELEALGEAAVSMRVTLSYFIEPNPSSRGAMSRYRYESHGLRFDVKRAHESVVDFRKRVNGAARDDGEPQTVGDDLNWAIGTNNRHKGSLHSDVWHGSAAELASRDVIGVYPAPGWWKTRPNLGRYEQRVRYSLLISIEAPETDVDLYTAVATQIETPVVIEY